MRLTQFLADSIGHTIVHYDEARGLVCLWYGTTSFLEYWVDDNGAVVHGSSWSAEVRPGTPDVAVARAFVHYVRLHG